ncbi:hypothetical protein TOPH_00067 [Tolypocladium ophioglossoides CBS 100239]|uniref:Uncharacterized protein n=1 Tax=Tolypocladium ophioglossoides (strain CBS 100239) TaxID=1163406 RepID=A0A0L0NMF6_TOLOC|nr:hypothetical protein TOPH_00067 [Tolypocladium ophioglossoides CBS 100239]
MPVRPLRTLWCHHVATEPFRITRRTWKVTTDVDISSIQSSKRPVAIALASPRFGKALASLGIRESGSTSSAEDAHFGRISSSLQESADIILQTLSDFKAQLTVGFSKAPAHLRQDWKRLIVMCTGTITQTESMLSVIKRKDPNAKSQRNFWDMCVNFIESWTGLIQFMKSLEKIPLPPGTRTRLKPIQHSMKETGNAIVNSPWHDLFRHSSLGRAAFLPMPTPITPQSAALGPVMQATVPTTPKSAPFAAAFHGNVFERADALLANPGISLSRSGTMKKGHAILKSWSSVSS